MTTLVCVVNKKGNPLMPCKPAKARHLLTARKAHVIIRMPFTIQLKWDCEENLQPNTLGIDKGSKFTGLSLLNIITLAVLFQAELRHRTDVKSKMESRKANRRSRRNRDWYRPRRFKNRSSMRREGRLPQSIKTNADEVLRVVKLLLRIIPINKVVVEDVLVDIRKLGNPDVKGHDYQKSNRLDENLRLACLMRDSFKCQNPKCKGHTKSLHAHHIVWRSKGGADTITNLITLCQKCHDDLHDLRWQLDIQGTSGFKDRIAQRTMQGKSYLYRELKKLVPELELVFGYETAERRHELGLEKTHMVDAYVISRLDVEGDNNYTSNNAYQVNFRPRQTRRQFLDLPQKGKGRVRYQVNEELEGFHKGDVVKVTTKGGKVFVKQINSIYSADLEKGIKGRLAFARVKGEPASALPKNCQLLERQKSIVFKAMQ